MKTFKLMNAALSNVAVSWTITFLDLCWGDLSSRGTRGELQEIECYKAEATIKPQLNTNVESFLFIFSSFFFFFFINCFVPSDHRQTTFMSLNKFFSLSKTIHPLFLTDNIKLDGIIIKIKRKMKCMPVLPAWSFEGTSYKKLQDTANSSFVSFVLHLLLHQQIFFFATF